MWTRVVCSSTLQTGEYTQGSQLLSFPSSESSGVGAGQVSPCWASTVTTGGCNPSTPPAALRSSSLSLLDCPGSNSPDQSPRPTVCLPCRREGLARLFLHHGTQICSKPNTDFIYFSFQVEMLVEGLW